MVTKKKYHNKEIKKKKLSKRKLKQPMLEVNSKDTQVEVQDDTKDASEENS